MGRAFRRGGAIAAAFLVAGVASGQVVLVEPGHQLVQHMDSVAPLHPSQTMLEQVQPIGDIESICVDPRSGDIFFQLIFPAGAPTSVTTHVFRLSPKMGGLVTPIALNTGFGINERGTDLQLDPRTGLLVTQDQNFGPPERIASINPLNGMIGTWSLVATPPIFVGGTFGMDFSAGLGNSIVPPGDVVFASDGGATGVHSCTFLGPISVTHVPPAALPGGGDDLVIQPDGDWIWVGDFLRPITQILPFPPFLATPSALSIQGMFAAAGLPFVAGSRAAVCDVTGVLYASFSGATGATGIFRVDEPLTTATLILTVGGPQNLQGIHDLEVGPSTLGPGASVYFTVHDYVTGAEQVWEVTAPACCPTPASTVVTPDVPPLNAPASIAAFPPGNQPRIGNAGFMVQLDDPALACRIPPGSPTFLLLNFWPALVPVPIPSLGCGPGAPGNVMIAPPAIVASGPVPWLAPLIGAVHPLPIPFAASLCGLPVFVQGVWLIPGGPAAPAVLSWRLDLILGS